VSGIAKHLGDIFSIVSFLFLSIIAIGIVKDGLLSLILLTPAIEAALLLSYVVLVLCGLTVVGTVVGWKNQYWSRRTRIHQTIMTAFAVAFTWGIYQIGFLPL
jgi:hypothetical protein